MYLKHLANVENVYIPELGLIFGETSLKIRKLPCFEPGTYPPAALDTINWVIWPKLVLQEQKMNILNVEKTHENARL